MCLYTKWKEPKKAKKDIIVYKILCENYISPYRGFSYNLGVKYDTDMKSCKGVFTNNIYVDDGFHAFTSKRALSKSYLKKYFTTGEVFKCIIPKGNFYYISSCKKEIVSDSIIIKRKLLFNIF